MIAFDKHISHDGCGCAPQSVRWRLACNGLVVNPMGISDLGSQLNLRVGIALRAYIRVNILRSTRNCRKGTHSSYESHAKCVHLFLLLFISPISCCLTIELAMTLSVSIT